MIKLIRYANEGFKGYDYYSEDEYTPKFVNQDRLCVEDWICGCYVFIEEEDPDALIMFSKDRTNEIRHEMLVPDDTLIWTWNKWIDASDKEFSHNYYKDFKGLLTWNSWIKMPAHLIAERVNRAKKLYGRCWYTFSEGILEIA